MITTFQSQNLLSKFMAHFPWLSSLWLAMTHPWKQHAGCQDDQRQEDMGCCEARNTTGRWSYRLGVLVSEVCHNKLPQTRQLTTTKIYYPTVLESRSPKWMCPTCWFLPQTCSVSLFQLVVITKNCWRFLACGYITAISASAVTWPSPYLFLCPNFPFVIKIPVTGLAQFSSVARSCLTLCDPINLHHARPPCPSSSPGVHSNSGPSSQWCHQAISSSVIPFSSCPQSLPASDSFPMSQLFAWGGQSTGVSA